MNKTLISELEDAIRRRRRRRSTDADHWAKDREAFINLAAWLMTIVETGDANAAAQKKDPGTASGS